MHLDVNVDTGRYAAQLARVPEWLEYHASLAEARGGVAPGFGDDADHRCVVTRLGGVGKKRIRSTLQ